MVLIRTNINSIKNPNISNRTLSDIVVGTPTYILNFLT